VSGLLVRAGAMVLMAAGSFLWAMGYHRHRCPKCGATWWHSKVTALDNEKAHDCPKCGAGPELVIS
jgi:predicted RNA-binding Zn-ribbon protein involved in translation (DUF1610 family)